MAVQPSVCIDAVYEGVAELDAIKAVSQIGYKAIEFWMWWEKDLTAILELCAQEEISIAACCTKFVSLVDPNCRSEYLDGLGESVEAAQRLGCKTLISQVGDLLQDVPRQGQHASLVEGLKEAAKILNGQGVTLAIEPLNELVDHQGYYLVRSDETFEIIREVGSSDVKVTFDIYHQQISEGNLISNIQSNWEAIAHFHAAGNPGRNELTSGEIDYPSVLDAIRQTGFQGYIGLEYWPKSDAADGLSEVLRWF